MEVLKLFVFLVFVFMVISCKNENEADYQPFDKLDDATVLDKIKKNKIWFTLEPKVDTIFNSLDSSKNRIIASGTGFEFDSTKRFYSARTEYRLVDDSLSFWSDGGNSYLEGIWKVSNGEISIENCFSYTSRQTLTEVKPCKKLIFGFKGDTLIVLDYYSFKRMKDEKRIFAWDMYLPPKVKTKKSLEHNIFPN